MEHPTALLSGCSKQHPPSHLLRKTAAQRRTSIGGISPIRFERGRRTGKEHGGWHRRLGKPRGQLLLFRVQNRILFKPEAGATATTTTAAAVAVVAVVFCQQNDHRPLQPHSGNLSRTAPKHQFLGFPLHEAHSRLAITLGLDNRGDDHGFQPPPADIQEITVLFLARGRHRERLRSSREWGRRPNTVEQHQTEYQGNSYR